MGAFSERVPPQDLEAEQAVLGACLIDSDILPVVMRELTADDFYAEKHQTVFEAIAGLNARREPVDMLTVQSLLLTRGKLDDIGGVAYLMTLVNQVPSTANTPHYAGIVAGKSSARRIQRAAREIVDECYRSEDIQALKSSAVHLLNGAVFDKASSRERHVGTAVLAYAEEVINAQASGAESPGIIKTPFKIQNQVMPMATGEVSVMVAASGIGKTTYEKALQMGVAKLVGPVKGYSLEMSPKQLMQKYWGLIARVNTMNIRLGKLTDAEIARTMEAVAAIMDVPLYFESHPRMKWADIKVDAMAFKARHRKIALITVDYVQILGDPTPRNGRRDAQLGEIIEDAKDLAVELDCHICFLAQQKINKDKPVGDNEDVAESRDIVRAADNVLFLTRPTEYKPDAKIELPVRDEVPGTPAWTMKQFECGQRDPVNQAVPMFKNVMLGFPGKQRMGSKQVIPYYFEPETGVVADLALPWPWDNPDRKPRKQEV